MGFHCAPEDEVCVDLLYSFWWSELEGLQEAAEDDEKLHLCQHLSQTHAMACRGTSERAVSPPSFSKEHQRGTTGFPEFDIFLSDGTDRTTEMSGILLCRTSQIIEKDTRDASQQFRTLLPNLQDSPVL